MGKHRRNSLGAFENLKNYTDRFYASELKEKEKIIAIKKAYEILSNSGIKLRQDDGSNPILTISVPEKGNVLVIGIRYIKKDKTKTEDHFVLFPKRDIYQCDAKEIEKLFPGEYLGVHKLQV